MKRVLYTLHDGYSEWPVTVGSVVSLFLALAALAAAVGLIAVLVN